MRKTDKIYEKKRQNTWEERDKKHEKKETKGMENTHN